MIRSQAAERRALSEVVRRVLTGGTLVAAALLAGGLIASLASERGLPHETVPIDRLPGGLAHLDPPALLSAGLVLVILTPAARVIGALLAFLHARDLRFAAVAAVVLTLMSVSLWLGNG